MRVAVTFQAFQIAPWVLYLPKHFFGSGLFTVTTFKAYNSSMAGGLHMGSKQLF